MVRTYRKRVVPHPPPVSVGAALAIVVAALALLALGLFRWFYGHPEMVQPTPSGIEQVR